MISQLYKTMMMKQLGHRKCTMACFLIAAFVLAVFFYDVTAVEISVNLTSDKYVIEPGETFTLNCSFPPNPGKGYVRTSESFLKDKSQIIVNTRDNVIHRYPFCDQHRCEFSSTEVWMKLTIYNLMENTTFTCRPPYVEKTGTFVVTHIDIIVSSKKDHKKSHEENSKAVYGWLAVIPVAIIIVAIIIVAGILCKWKRTVNSKKEKEKLPL